VSDLAYACAGIHSSRVRELMAAHTVSKPAARKAATPQKPQEPRPLAKSAKPPTSPAEARAWVAFIRGMPRKYETETSGRPPAIAWLEDAAVRLERGETLVDYVGVAEAFGVPVSNVGNWVSAARRGVKGGKV
jgi:hypothetical protein